MVQLLKVNMMPPAERCLKCRENAATARCAFLCVSLLKKPDQYSVMTHYECVLVRLTVRAALLFSMVSVHDWVTRACSTIERQYGYATRPLISVASSSSKDAFRRRELKSLPKRRSKSPPRRELQGPLDVCLCPLDTDLNNRQNTSSKDFLFELNRGIVEQQEKDDAELILQNNGTGNVAGGQARPPAIVIGNVGEVPRDDVVVITSRPTSPPTPSPLNPGSPGPGVQPGGVLPPGSTRPPSIPTPGMPNLVPGTPAQNTPGLPGQTVSALPGGTAPNGLPVIPVGTAGLPVIPVVGTPGLPTITVTKVTLGPQTVKPTSALTARPTVGAAVPTQPAPAPIQLPFIPPPTPISVRPNQPNPTTPTSTPQPTKNPTKNPTRGPTPQQTRQPTTKPSTLKPTDGCGYKIVTHLFPVRFDGLRAVHTDEYLKQTFALGSALMGKSSACAPEITRVSISSRMQEGRRLQNGAVLVLYEVVAKEVESGEILNKAFTNSFMNYLNIVLAGRSSIGEILVMGVTPDLLRLALHWFLWLKYIELCRNLLGFF